MGRQFIFRPVKNLSLYVYAMISMALLKAYLHVNDTPQPRHAVILTRKCPALDRNFDIKTFVVREKSAAPS